MCEDVVSIAALVVSVVAIVVSVVFYFKSTKALQNAIDVLAGWMEGKVKGSDVTFHRNKKGHCDGVNVTVHLRGNEAQAHVSSVAPVTSVPKKPD